MTPRPSIRLLRARRLILAGGLCWAAAASASTCLDCHAAADLQVRAPHLSTCYQLWQDSAHARAQVGCADCHGGAEGSIDSSAAPGRCPAAGAAATDFRRVPETCGRCHGEVLAAFRESRHFQRLQTGKEGREGPNCVTCHGSMGASRVESAQVERLCASCHDGRRAPAGAVPGRARAVLEEMASIRRFSAWLGLHEQDPGFERREREQQIRLWHRFDLDGLEGRAAQRLQELKSRVHVRQAEELKARKARRK
jgi:hypothetical protein